MGERNHIELDWAVDGITVGTRHRKDLGDLQPLVDSIQQYGLLQPLTITDEGVLICGARRLAAIKVLGWRQVNVWVRVGLSDKLSAMMAQRDENTCHKPFTKLELANLYEELKAEIAADATRRQHATKYVDGHAYQVNGVAKLATPLHGAATGDSRHQAAAMIGGTSHMTMEKITTIRQIAADTTRPQAIRQQAVDALKQLEAGSPVDPLFHQLRLQVRINDLERITNDENEDDAARQAALSGVILLHKLENTAMGDADLDKAARAALERVKNTRKQNPPTPQRKQPAPTGPRLRTVKSFLWTWNELRNWPTEYDPQAVAAEVTQTQWDQFTQTMADSISFMNTVNQLRETT